MEVMSTTSWEEGSATWTVDSLETTTGNGTMAPLRPSSLRGIVEIILFVVLSIGMFGIGCGVELDKLLNHFKKPTGAIIGIASQFLIMPIAAFALASILQMNGIRTMTLLIMGSCPGGSVSNVVVVWVDGDVDLSVCMTTVSCFLAFGIMPLMLWIYSLIYSNTLQVPFQSIGITLAIVVGPIAIGAIFRRKQPKIAKILLKVFSAIGIVAIIVLIVIAVLTYGRIYSVVVGQVIASLILPLCGLVLGYGLASLISLRKAWRLEHYQRRTIALETGVQNVQLALGIVTLSGFSFQQEAQVVLFPVLYLAGQGIWIVIIIIGYNLYKKYYMPNYAMPVTADDNEAVSDSSAPSYKKEQEYENEAFEPDETRQDEEAPPRYSESQSYKATTF